MASQQKTAGAGCTERPSKAVLWRDSLEGKPEPRDLQEKWLAARLGLSALQARLIAELAFNAGVRS
jgi:hypothetical protein